MFWAKKVPLHGGDQNPLSSFGGWMRTGALAAKGYQFAYFVHDAETAGEVRQPSLVVQNFGDLAIAEDRIGMDVWFSLEFHFPFCPLPWRADDVRKALHVGDSRARELSLWGQQRLGTYRRGIVIPGDHDFTMADLDPRKWSDLPEVLREGLRQEVANAAAFADVVGAQGAERADWVLDHANIYGSTTDFQVSLWQGIASVPSALTTSVEYWSLDQVRQHPERLSLLTRFLSDPAALKIYNEIAAAGKKREHSDWGPAQRQLPFWVIQEINGHLVRQDLYIGTDAGLMFPPADQGPKSLEELLKLLSSSTVAIVPKAICLLVQQRMLGRVFLTGVPYRDQAAELAKKLGLKLHPLLQIKFDVKKAMAAMGLWPDENVPFVRVELSVEERQSPFVKWLWQRGLERWKERTSLVFAYIVGGDELIQEIYQTAVFQEMAV